MIKLIRMTVAVTFLLYGSGCATTERVNTAYDTGPEVIGLDYRDFELAAKDAVRSLVESPHIQKYDSTGAPAGRRVMTIGHIKNDTRQRIDTDQLVKKIRVELLNSGKVVVTTAVGGSGPEDAMSRNVRQLRDDPEFRQSTVPKTGQMLVPELSLSGKIFERSLQINSRKQQVEYYFMLSMTEVKTGVAIWEWESNSPIVKRGSSKSVTW